MSRAIPLPLVLMVHSLPIESIELPRNFIETNPSTCLSQFLVVLFLLLLDGQQHRLRVLVLHRRAARRALLRLGDGVL